MPEKGFWQVYSEQLRERYLGEILITLSSILAIFLEMQGQDEITLFGIGAIIFLVAWFITIFYRIYRNTKILVHDVQSSYFLCLDTPRGMFMDAHRAQDKHLKVTHKVNLEETFQYYRVLDDDRVFFSETHADLSDWSQLLFDIQKHFFRYAQRIPISTQQHLFLKAPAPITIGLGYAVGKVRNNTWNVYYFSKGSYYGVSLQFLPVNLNSYKHIEVSSYDITDMESKEIALIISIANEKRRPDKSQIKHTTIEVNLTSQRRLEVDDFSKVAAEITQFINHELAGRFSVIHLYAGVPVALGFIIGWYLEDNIDISLYNRNIRNGVWECVLELPMLQSYDN